MSVNPIKNKQGRTVCCVLMEVATIRVRANSDARFHIKTYKRSKFRAEYRALTAPVRRLPAYYFISKAYRRAFRGVNWGLTVAQRLAWINERRTDRLGGDLTELVCGI